MTYDELVTIHDELFEIHTKLTAAGMLTEANTLATVGDMVYNTLGEMETAE